MSTKVKKIIFFALIVCTFYGCANTTVFQHIDPEYADKKIFSTSVLLLTLSDDVIPVKKKAKLLQGQIKEHRMFSQQEKKLFNDYFGPTFSEYITAKVIGIDLKFKPESVKFNYKKLTKENTGKGFAMFVPEKGQIQYNGMQPNYVIFFEDLFFDKKVVADGGGLGQGSSSSIGIVSGLKYLIWDNKQEKIAGYGSLEKDFTLMEMPDKLNYIKVFEDYVKQIVSNSPFRNKKSLK